MSAYYNEIDQQKAAWLRELIKAGVIAPGEVDERDIKEIKAADLRGFAQCHFFAGIGVWSYALRLAGWPDDRPVWTGSCPCPSFSAAGQGRGFNDSRHLWPDWARLIGERRPATVFGEQVDDAIGHGWLDLVQTDLERAEYAVGKAVLGACSVGAPHIRQRLYFVGRRLTGVVAQSQAAEAFTRSGEVSARAGTHNANGFGISGDAHRVEHSGIERCGEAGRAESGCGSGGNGALGELADADGRGQPVRGQSGEGQSDREQRSESSGMGDSECGTPERRRYDLAGTAHETQGEARQREWFRPESGTGSYVNGFWRDADWVLRKRWNRDDWEWCPTEPGAFPLVTGAPARVLRLCGYGDALCAPVAAEFIKSYLETLSGHLIPDT